jgi:enamine deaminase RidA (YjgF/YER057c/UK114 family)
MHLTGCTEQSAAAAEQARDLYASVFHYLQDAGAEIVQERIYGTLSARDSILAERETAAEASAVRDLPSPTFVQGGPCAADGGLAGVQIKAVMPTEAGDPPAVEDLMWQGRACGRTVSRGGADFLYIGDVGAHVVAEADGLNRADQSRVVFEAAGEMLAAHGLSFTDVVRTWVYLDDILSWYDDFNKMRNSLFKRVGLMGDAAPAFIPASTGIESSNPWGLGCALDLLAVRRSADGGPALRMLSNPRQSEAYSYKSAFARGACVDEGDVNHIYVSGTAAIDGAGRSVCIDDLDGQVEYTLRNVEALLAEANAGFADMAEATIFFKHGIGDADIQRAMDTTELGGIPGVIVRADVCRDDLLFEIDGTAMVASSSE